MVAGRNARSGRLSVCQLRPARRRPCTGVHRRGPDASPGRRHELRPGGAGERLRRAPGATAAKPSPAQSGTLTRSSYVSGNRSREDPGLRPDPGPRPVGPWPLAVSQAIRWKIPACWPVRPEPAGSDERFPRYAYGPHRAVLRGRRPGQPWDGRGPSRGRFRAGVCGGVPPAILVAGIPSSGPGTCPGIRPAGR